MWNFEYQVPVKLIFGRGKIVQIGVETARWGKKALIVTSASSARTGLLAKVTASLSAAGVDYIVYDKVKPNPLATMIAEGTEIVARENCDVIVGIGGGSPMDTAKAIAFSAKNPGDYADYVFGGKPGTGALPIILATTTAGTGSEANSLAVCTNPANNDKKGIKSPFIYPKASIIDPELMTTLPKKVIAATGMDALFHSIESYLSRRSYAMSEMISLEAIRLLCANLRKVYSNPDDLDAWDRVVFGNSLGGMSIDCAGTALPHAMEHPVSGLLDVTHGEGLAALYIPILEFILPAAPDRLADIAAAMGISVAGLSPEAAGAKAIEAVKLLGTDLGIPMRLGLLGVEEKHIAWLAENTFKTMKIAAENTPRTVTLEDVKAIYRRSL